LGYNTPRAEWLNALWEKLIDPVPHFTILS